MRAGEPPVPDPTWPETYDGGEAGYSAATVGVMVDESFARAILAVCPHGRSPVTTELAIDLACFAGRGTGFLKAAGHVLARSPDSALARACLTDAADSVVATATTRCHFLALDERRGGRPGARRKPPPALLAVASMTEAEVAPARRVVEARFTPDERCGNDLGLLHGGIAAAALLEVGLRWLRMIYGDAVVASIRINFVRPNRLGDTVTIKASPIHAGRSSGVTALAGRDPAGKLTVAATVTGTPLVVEPDRLPAVSAH